VTAARWREAENATHSQQAHDRQRKRRLSGRENRIAAREIKTMTPDVIARLLN
jgi:hypothetical protein